MAERAQGLRPQFERRSMYVRKQQRPVPTAESNRCRARQNSFRYTLRPPDIAGTCSGSNQCRCGRGRKARQENERRCRRFRGNLVAFQRMDGAMLASIEIAEHKARAAALFRRETKIFENAIQVNNFTYLMTLDGFIASRGGIPSIENGKLIGGIGCSGGTDPQDETVCRAGVAVIEKT